MDGNQLFNCFSNSPGLARSERAQNQQWWPRVRRQHLLQCVALRVVQVVAVSGHRPLLSPPFWHSRKHHVQTDMFRCPMHVLVSVNKSKANRSWQRSSRSKHALELTAGPQQNTILSQTLHRNFIQDLIWGAVRFDFNQGKASPAD